MENKEPYVYILDDDEDVCVTIRVMLETVGLRAHTFNRADDLLAALENNLPSCLVLDVRIPEMSGLEIQEYLNQHQMYVPIIFITAYGDIAMAVEAIKRGAFNFIEKPFRSQVLLDNIQRAVKDDECRRNQTDHHDQINAKLNTLTDRERQVLNHLLLGKNNKIVARELAISPKTVDYHRSNVMRKLRVETLIELARVIHLLEPLPPSRLSPVGQVRSDPAYTWSIQ